MRDVKPGKWCANFKNNNNNQTTKKTISNDAEGTIAKKNDSAKKIKSSFTEYFGRDTLITNKCL